MIHSLRTVKPLVIEGRTIEPETAVARVDLLADLPLDRLLRGLEGGSIVAEPDSAGQTFTQPPKAADA